MVARVTSQNFEGKVLKSDLPVLACFIAPWCRSCFALCLVMQGLSKEYKQTIRFVEIDAEAEPELMERYHLRALPAILLFEGGKLVKKSLGFRSRAPLKNLLDMLAARKQEDV